MTGELIDRELQVTAGAFVEALQTRAHEQNLQTLTANDLTRLASEVDDDVLQLELPEAQEVLFPEALALRLVDGIDLRHIEEIERIPAVSLSEMIAEIRKQRLQKLKEGTERRRKQAEETIFSIPARLAMGATTGPLQQFKRIGRPGSPSKPGFKTFAQEFEYGSIHTLDGTMPLAIPCTYYAADIFVAAIKCFGTDDPGGEDEPYLVCTVINPTPAACGGPNVASVWRSPVFEGIEGGRIFGENQAMFQDVVVGRHGIALKLALFDQEHGSADSVRAEIEKQAARVANTITDAIEALTQVDIDQALKEQQLEDNILDTLGDISVGLLTDILKDDFIDEKTWIIPPRMIIDWVDKGAYEQSGVVYPPEELPTHIDTNYPRENVLDHSWIFSGGGGSYKIYLRIVPYRNDHITKGQEKPPLLPGQG